MIIWIIVSIFMFLLTAGIITYSYLKPQASAYSFKCTKHRNKSRFTSANNIKNNYPIIDSVNMNNFVILNSPKAISPSDDEFLDFNRAFKDIATDFVVGDFFTTSDTLFSFLKIVNDTHVSKISEYVKEKKLPNDSIIFLYKGGQVLRILANDFLTELPVKARKTLSDYYMKFFKRTDSDFSIAINPYLPNFKTILEDMNLLTWELQHYLRTTFMENPFDYFNYYRYNDKFQKKQLTNILKNYADASSLKDKNNKLYYESTVTGLIFLDNKVGENVNDLNYIPKSDRIIRSMTSIDKIPNNDPIFITRNNALKFASPNGTILEFDLVRSKFNFDIIVRNKEGNIKKVATDGELIDVSIPKDESLKDFFKDLKMHTAKYILHKDKNIIEFTSYSIMFLIEDLTFMLYRQKDFPWYDIKYEKRLNRIMYLYFLDIMGMMNNLQEVIDYYSSLEKIYKESKFGDKDIEPLLEKYPNLEINTLLEYSILFAVNIKKLDSSKVLEDTPKYIKYNNTILDNISVIKKTLDINLKDYLCDEGLIDDNELYEGDFSSLV
jgi:hypothetical protein